MFALSQHVFIIIPLGHLVTLLELRNIFAENMVKKNGNVTNVPRFMLFNLIGRLTLRPVALKSIDVTVEPSSLGRTVSLPTEHSVMLWLQKVPGSRQTQR